MDWHYQLGNEEKAVRLERDGEVAQITIADRVYAVKEIRSRPGELALEIDGVRQTVFAAANGQTHFIAIDGDVFELKKLEAQQVRRKRHRGEDNLSASMPGQVAKVLVSAGDIVQRGQPLIVLEAMKMEIKIAAPHDGHVAKILVKPGEVVDRGQALIEMSNE
ncbi:MAG TPA: biotin/lipoyl-containing protein [Anaerolineae bacterium]|nr:biotin/lipoyl-containing protein [Anaerolineae bacterium]